MTAPTTTEKPPMSLREEILEKVAALVTIAFGLVAALAWNTAVQKAFDQYFGAGGTLLSVFTYAIAVTIVAVLATIWIGRTVSKAHQLSSMGRRPIA